VLDGSVTDVRAMSLEVKGQFGKFLGAEKGSLLQSYETPVMLMSRNEGKQVFVDLSVVGANVQGMNRPGEVVVLRFEGKPQIQLVKNEARSSNNAALPVKKVIGAGEAVPTAFTLGQNYPNPFNPTTTIEYQVPVAGQVTMEVYSLLGQKVATLLQEVQEPGFYQVQWNGKDLNQQAVASGVYFYRLHVGDFTNVKRMMLLK
jgi:hypothetical protein